MKEYIVRCREVRHYEVEVEAETKEDAIAEVQLNLPNVEDATDEFFDFFEAEELK